MRFDLHVHTELSPCSRLTVAQIRRQARLLGLDGVCLTDHDTMAAAHLVREGLQDDGLCLIIGLEYATAEGDILLFGPLEDLPPGLSARRVIGLARSLGGVAIAAHPFRTWRPAGPGILDHPGLSGLEVRNGRNRPEENAAAARFAAERNLPALAGSDAHSLDELGRMPLEVDAVVRGRADFVAALLAGRYRLPQLDPVWPGLGDGHSCPTFVS
ncbi:MAG: PHP-associated domain-containing protein [Solidesulfovibrio sp. DCME]|uniref:PHP-associated domain-containing protein n=1 Tax=Solidesulfovibrio sp. DCME TaxID=3447380 RepID=UPI003D14E43F